MRVDRFANLKYTFYSVYNELYKQPDTLQKGSYPMRKKLTLTCLLCCLIFSLFGCGKKTTVVMSFDDITDFETTQYPANLDSFSETDDSITVSLKKDGDYDFRITDQDGNEHCFTLKYHNKSVDVESESSFGISLEIK